MMIRSLRRAISLRPNLRLPTRGDDNISPRERTDVIYVFDECLLGILEDSHLFSGNGHPTLTYLCFFFAFFSTSDDSLALWLCPVIHSGDPFFMSAYKSSLPKKVGTVGMSYPRWRLGGFRDGKERKGTGNGPSAVGI